MYAGSLLDCLCPTVLTLHFWHLQLLGWSVFQFDWKKKKKKKKCITVRLLCILEPDGKSIEVGKSFLKLREQYVRIFLFHSKYLAEFVIGCLFDELWICFR